MSILPYTLEKKKQVSPSLLGNLRSIERCDGRHSPEYRLSEGTGVASRMRRHIVVMLLPRCADGREVRG